MVTAVEDFLARCLFQLRQDLPVHSLFASVRLMVYDLQRDWNSSEPGWSSTASSTCRMYVYRHNSSSTAYQPRIETKPDSFQRSKSSSCARFGSTWLSLHPSRTHTHPTHKRAPKQAAHSDQRPSEYVFTRLCSRRRGRLGMLDGTRSNGSTSMPGRPSCPPQAQDWLADNGHSPIYFVFGKAVVRHDGK